MSCGMTALFIGITATLGAGLVAVRRLDRAVGIELRTGKEDWRSSLA